MTVKVHKNSGKHHGKVVCEVNWDPEDMPFKYAKAPILIRNNEDSDFSTIVPFVQSKKKQSFESRLASLLRSRTQEVSGEMAKEIVAVYTRKRRNAKKSAIAENYEEALPYNPPKVDRKRRETYDHFVKNLTVGLQSRCRKPPCLEPVD